ncbi:cytochrome c3 family protein [Psychromarinibacter sp. C21-152]|uniref:Cytochrome c3 family protein n=1 Tax=Psychromarinibacter sediminicola TaxID=3033385 RepID=A0AAE3NTQ2_9RHOB|nr:cytochrome c3 family protein [Psychromarinibacter sediminicola]MDF0601871.1 cytochrome c3 family protein [Psychromarinibacter sediminicola]
MLPDSGPFSPETIEIKNAVAIGNWARSGHSDRASESFSHWDEDGEVPAVCATCHAGAGFRSFHGLDGSEPGVREEPFPIGGVVDCETCHHPGLSQVAEITLPSGVEHPVQGGEAACFTCHQGRAAGATVSEAVGDMPEDEPNPEFRFVNPHYNQAAATWLGGYGESGYHYPGKSYSGRFLHAQPVASCASCHEPHSLEVAEEACEVCHFDAAPKDIRISRVSYDGSGDTTKGIRADIDANAAKLLDEIETYAAEVAGTPILYEAHYPYFFADANGDGVADEADGRSVSYNAWTPRLLKAAFNWKFVTADPGVHAHNPHYALELLYDSIEDLASTTGTDFEAMGLLR